MSFSFGYHQCPAWYLTHSGWHFSAHPAVPRGVPLAQRKTCMALSDRAPAPCRPSPTLSHALFASHTGLLLSHRGMVLAPAPLPAWTQTLTKLASSTLFLNLSSQPQHCLFYFSPQHVSPMNTLYLLFIHCWSFPHRMSTLWGKSETAPLKLQCLPLLDNWGLVGSFSCRPGLWLKWKDNELD